MIAKDRSGETQFCQCRQATLTLRIETLVRDLLREATASLLVRTDVTVLGREAALKKPSSVLRAEL